MKKLLFVLCLPFFAYASNQDKLLIADMDAMIASLQKIQAYASENDDLKVSRELGVVAARFYMAGNRAQAVYKNDPSSSKVATGIGMAAEYFSKSLNAFSGIDTPEMQGDLKPGNYDSAFNSRIAEMIKGFQQLKAGLKKRDAKNSAQEYYERDLTVLSSDSFLLTSFAEQIRKFVAEIPNKSVALCFYGGSMDALLSQIDADLKYIVATDAGFNSIASLAHQQATGDRYSASFCGTADTPVEGIVHNKNTPLLAAIINADYALATSLQIAVEKVK